MIIPRFRIRTLMIAVASVCVGFWLAPRDMTIRIARPERLSDHPLSRFDLTGCHVRSDPLCAHLVGRVLDNPCLCAGPIERWSLAIKAR
ncbi:MAG: hypothetical protein P4L84_04095 [Isosphaeraceae bacterium]|nr:hypothetical protein [Isosphaeraceae bacterium]